MCRHPCLQAEMPPVIIAGGIIILNAVQPVLHRMIMYSGIIQIISDRIGIAEHIDIPILPKVHRYIFFFQPAEHLCIFHARKHIQQQIAPVCVVFLQLGEKVSSFSSNITTSSKREQACARFRRFPKSFDIVLSTSVALPRCPAGSASSFKHVTYT